MKTVDLHEAQTNFTSLIEAASLGEDLLITRAGKPLVRVVAVEASTTLVARRFGLLRGLIDVPDDIDAFGQAEIEEMFGLGDDRSAPESSGPGK